MAAFVKNASLWPGRSRRGWLLLACFGSSLLFLLFQGGKLALMVFVMISILSLYLILGKWSGISRTKGNRTLFSETPEPELTAGMTLRVKLGVRIPGFWPIPYVTIQDVLIRNNGVEHVFEGALIPGLVRRGNLEYTTPPLVRGLYTFGRTYCSTKDIFGIFEHNGAIDLQDNFLVLPRTVLIKEWKNIYGLLGSVNHHSATARSFRETTQVNGVREYNYGDRLSRIHWNATAKTGTWKSKEFERESLPKTVIVLDRHYRNYSNREQFELAVSIAASLLAYGKNREFAPGLLSVGNKPSFFEPSRSQHYYRDMLYHLAEVEADGTYSLTHVLNDHAKLLGSGICMIIISPDNGEQTLHALAWLKQRQMTGCHIWLTDSREEGKRWCGQLANTGFSGYAVSALEELPMVLGGVG